MKDWINFADSLEVISEVTMFYTAFDKTLAQALTFGVFRYCFFLENGTSI